MRKNLFVEKAVHGHKCFTTSVTKHFLKYIRPSSSSITIYPPIEKALIYLKISLNTFLYQPPNRFFKNRIRYLGVWLYWWKYSTEIILVNTFLNERHRRSCRTLSTSVMLTVVKISSLTYWKLFCESVFFIYVLFLTAYWVRSQEFWTLA